MKKEWETAREDHKENNCLLKLNRKWKIRILSNGFLFKKDYFFHTKLSSCRVKFLYSNFLLFIYLSCNIYVTL